MDSNLTHDAAAPAAAPPAGSGRVGVVDIGSNTVRLVVYDTPTRLPIPIFNEKAQCELGRGVAETGLLNPQGVDLALRSLARFAGLAEAMGVERLDLVATAAVRDSDDGPAFVAQVEYALGLPVQVLSGDEEAKLAALGLLSGVPDADGLLGDLGGGSLDLVALDKGVYGNHATLPVGQLRLQETSGDKPDKAAKIVEKELAKLEWLEEIKGRALYAVGGSWRALARIFIDQTSYPLHVVDHYAIPADEALRLTRLIAHLGPKTIERIQGISKRRILTLPYSALALEAMIEAAEPNWLVFSGFGMREGQLLKNLPEDLRDQDPLIAACASTAERTGRFQIGGEELMSWTKPVFGNETPAERRLRLAACYLSDIGWSEHPDYRAEHAFSRVLRVPFAGLTHRDRVFLALAVLIRYNGDDDSEVVAPVRNLLDDNQVAKARSIGLALRLGHTLSGSAPGLLSRATLSVEKEAMKLEMAKGSESFMNETVERRLKTLARSLELEPIVS